MRSVIVAGTAGVLVSVLMFACSLSAVICAAGGIVAFIVFFAIVSALESGGPQLTRNTTAKAVQDARKRLNRIRLSAIKARSNDLIQAAADLNAGYEAVFEQIEGNRDGYARVGLTLSLLKPLAEAAEECVRYRASAKFPELVEQLKQTFTEALEDLNEKAEDLTEADLKAFENRCNTVKVIAARD